MRRCVKMMLLTSILSMSLLSASGGMVEAGSVTIDESTFNQLVTRAKEADVLEKEKDFYKEKYEAAVSRSLELNALYKEDISLKDRIISSQKEIAELQLERIKTKDDIIGMQDKRISRLERRNTLKDILLLSIAGGGIALAADNSDSGAALGIGAAAVLSLIIK